MEENKILKCEVQIKKVLYKKDSFTITSCKIIKILEGEYEGKKNNIVVKGNIPSKYDKNEIYTLLCEVGKQHPKYGTEYNIVYIGKPSTMNTLEEKKNFMSMFLTENQIESIIKSYPYNPLQPFYDEDIQGLCKIKGIKTVTCYKMIKKFKENLDVSDAYLELKKYGLSLDKIKKLVQIFKGSQIAIEEVTKNPYILIEKLSGVSFKTADKYALNVNPDKFNSFRIKAFIKFFLEEQGNQKGNTVVDSKLLLREIKEITGEITKEQLVEIKKITNSMNILWKAEDSLTCALTEYRNLEENIANELIRIKKHCNDTLNYEDYIDLIKESEKKQNWEYNQEQIEAMQMVLQNSVSAIIGYGGCGKTSIVNMILNILNYDNEEIGLCALSGKASLRISQCCENREGYTIHRLLGQSQTERGFLHNSKKPLKKKIIVLDEGSMVDAKLFYSLVQAIPNGCRLIILGDIGQLSSLSIGNVLKNIVDSKVIPCSILTKIHRQAQKSGIIVGSIKVWNGEQLCSRFHTGFSKVGELEDLYLDIYKKNKNIEEDKYIPLQKAIEHFKREFELDNDIMNIQLSSPVKNKGTTSCAILNNEIQKIYNPKSENKKEISITSEGVNFVLREGDKVICNTNNYQLFTTDGEQITIYNGNLGILKQIKEEDDSLIINFQGIEKDVVIPFNFCQSIFLGYCISVHRLQGSQVPCIIGVVTFDSYSLLDKELIYTLMTRGQKKSIIIAHNMALFKAIETSKTTTKTNFLESFLKEKDVTTYISNNDF